MRHKHKHKKNGSVRFSYAYAYVAGVLTCFSGAYASAYAYAMRPSENQAFSRDLTDAGMMLETSLLI